MYYYCISVHRTAKVAIFLQFDRHLNPSINTMHLVITYFTFSIVHTKKKNPNGVLFVNRECYQSRGAYSSAYHDCMLFNNPNSHRTVESLGMTCTENGCDLFLVNLNSLLFGKFHGSWTRSNLLQAWNWSLHEVWETTMNTQQRCGGMYKITEIWLNTASFGHMEHYHILNVAPTELYKMWECNIFLLQPFKHQQICKPT